MFNVQGLFILKADKTYEKKKKMLSVNTFVTDLYLLRSNSPLSTECFLKYFFPYFYNGENVVGMIANSF